MGHGQVRTHFWQYIQEEIREENPQGNPRCFSSGGVLRKYVEQDQTQMRNLILVCFLIASCSAAPKNERYGFNVDERPWRGSRLDNRDIKKPYRQCVEKITLKNIEC